MFSDRGKTFWSGLKAVLPRGSRVFVFGDSHSVCAGQAKGALLAYAGPVTLNRLGRPGEAVALLRQFAQPSSRLLRRLCAALAIPVVRSGDAVLVVVGEIDVRCHVQPQMERTDRTADDVIDGLGESAVRCAQELRAILPARVYFCAVIPPSEGKESSEWPFRGTLEERAAWTESLNRVLSDRLSIIGVEVLDPYARYRERTGVLGRQFRDESVHLADAYGAEAFEPLVRRIRQLAREPRSAGSAGTLTRRGC